MLAKQLYTKKKNALIIIIERAQTLLGVLNVEVDRLEGAKKKLNSALDAFDTAYDGLIAILIEDDTQAVEKEEKDEEQRTFEITIAGLDDDLDRIIAERNRDHGAQRLQQERQAEADRLQREAD